MVYNIQNYWGFGLYRSSRILETKKHNVSETGSVSVTRGREIPTPMGLLDRANLSPMIETALT
jgi:hypothetical protein